MNSIRIDAARVKPELIPETKTESVWWSRVRLAVLLSCFPFVLGGKCFDGLDNASGNVVWQIEGGGWAVPTFDNTTVYFTGLHRELVAVDKLSGALRWKRTLPVDPSAGGDTMTSGFGSAIAGGTVVAVDAGLYGLNATDGSQRWAFKPQWRIQRISLVGSDGTTIYAGTGGGMVYAIDASTGLARWQTTIFEDSNTAIYSPVSGDGVVFASFTVFSWNGPGTPLDSGGTVALDASTGTIKWMFYYPRRTPETSPRGWSPVALGDTHVFAAAQGGTLFALDRRDGSLAWQGPPADLVSHGIEAIAVAKNRVYVGFTSGVIAAFEVGTGKELWRTRPCDCIADRLRADNNGVYVGLGGSSVAALDPANGQLRWRVGAGGTLNGWELLSAPSIDDQMIYVAGAHEFVALRK